MHRVRAAIMSGGVSAYRLIVSKPGQPAPRRRRDDAGDEPILAPDIVARAGPHGLSRQELAAAIHKLRDIDSVPGDDSLAHWVSSEEPGEQPLLPKNVRPADCDDAVEEPGLAGEMIPRRESRTADTRREDRIPGTVETATLRFRDEDHIVRVVNTSSRGLQVESELNAHIAELVSITLDGGVATPCFVRWIRGGRIGLGFREEDLG